MVPKKREPNSVSAFVGESMSDLAELQLGIALLVISIGALIVSLPRKGKVASFVQKPYLAPMVSIIIITGFAVGLIMLAAHFTAIDDATLSGYAKRS